jgi:hypothetical protein
VCKCTDWISDNDPGMIQYLLKLRRGFPTPMGSQINQTTDINGIKRWYEPYRTTTLPAQLVGRRWLE